MQEKNVEKKAFRDGLRHLGRLIPVRIRLTGLMIIKAGCDIPGLQSVIVQV